MSSEEKSIVIDNGAAYIKPGIGGEEFPKSYFQTIVGYPMVE